MRFVFASLVAITAAAPALAQDSELTPKEYTVPWEKTRPRDPIMDQSGRVWFVGQVGNYVGAAWGDRKASLTIAQMLSNSSGMVGLVDDPLYAPYICQYRHDGTLSGCAEKIYQANDSADIVPPEYVEELQKLRQRGEGLRQRVGRFRGKHPHRACHEAVALHLVRGHREAVQLHCYRLE